MNKTEINKIRRIMKKTDYYEFDDGTGKSAIIKYDHGILHGTEYELRVLNGYWNTVICHLNLERILELLED